MAARVVEFSVTANHIKKGQTTGNGRRTQTCPIALSIRSRGYKDVNVVDTFILFTTKNGAKEMLQTPANVQRFINRSDKIMAQNNPTKNLRPFTFRIKLVPAS